MKTEECMNGIVSRGTRPSPRKVFRVVPVKLIISRHSEAQVGRVAFLNTMTMTGNQSVAGSDQMGGLFTF